MFVVTVTEADVVLPDVSVAIAVIVCDPSAVLALLQTSEYGGDVIAEPRLIPSIWNCTLATATLSLAEAASVTEPETVEYAVGVVIETLGGV